MEKWKNPAAVRSLSRRAETSVSSGTKAESGIDVRALSLFQADIIASYQYYATFQRRLYLSPERILMLAVLQDAVTCLQCYVASRQEVKRRLYLEAEAWILDEDRLHVFAFENVCDALGLDASFLRRGLMRWKRQALLQMSRSGLNSREQSAKARLPGSNANLRGYPGPRRDRTAVPECEIIDNRQRSQTHE